MHFLCCFSFAVCGKTPCMNTKVEAMQCSATFMGETLGEGMLLLAHRLALAYANVRLYVVPLHCFRLYSILGEENGGCRGVCIVPHGMLGEVTQRTVLVKTP